ncbi:MAG: 50S ribosomal protein L31 [Magnetococcales bacterium]|nr:50S ribosomal protein L31 [Magnetococcales bacterium]
MKEGIHPEYKEVTFTCIGCSTVIQTRSTGGDQSLAVCSSCHPFFTGKHKLVDTAGRVERFIRKYGSSGTGSPPPKS